MMDNFSKLPEECISQILSMTSPRDACRLSAISSLFNAAAISDSLWESFLPSDYREIVSRSVSPVVFSTKKQLYFSLCESPPLLDGGRLSLGLDRESGKKCFIIPARELKNAWKEDSRNTLSANTTYAPYLIFKIANQRHSGLELLPVKASVRLVQAGEDEYEDDKSSTVFLTSQPLESWRRGENGRLPQIRRDGWMEIELGEFYTDEGDDGWVEIELGELYIDEDGGVEMRLREVSGLETRLIVGGR
ncbi:hypothetical protein Vadar_024790 [Vaccinium darrowii]|uniref:Uncharacterized protein n=1 Tax=Vaccinium darrowii TaxID=229202 RepID=A0ACB7X3K9_9ERIC|nr:hypothetical protein Vadar_024790 [Vaccinium darrowii]